MANMLCDELLQEIFTKLPTTPSSSLSVCLVSKRWLHLYRTSKISLSLRIIPDNSIVLSMSSLLSNYPLVSSLSVALSSSEPTTTTKSNPSFFDHLLFVVSSSCSNLKHLRFSAGPVSVSSLLSLSTACNHLTSLTVSLPRSLYFNWVASFSCLKELSVYACDADEVQDEVFQRNRETGLCLNEELNTELGLESLCLSGFRSEDMGVGWLWRSCKRLKKLQLKNCSGIGDGGSFANFAKCLQGLQEVKLRTCRGIVDLVLLNLAESCDSLNSLLVYDGCSRDGLLQFIRHCRCNLQKLDFRLPLDLNNAHLSAVAVKFRGLSTLRLQSCCLVSGDGLKALGIAVSSGLAELALINCDVVEREPGLLASLGQNLKQLRKLDLSYNETLRDKEFMAMLVSCNYLTEMKVRGCKGLTSMAVVSMSKSCKRLQAVDIMHCCGVGAEAVELFVLNSPQLRRVEVDKNKLSDVARTWASYKFIEGLQEVKLRTCRGIVDLVLLNLAESCDSLNSLLVYDGCSRDGLLQFIRHCRCNLQKLDFRLPLDLNNAHLSAVAVKFRGLSTLRLQSCCLVSGDGLKALGIAVSSGLAELALINCDVVEREPGLLASLGQNLKQLRKLDLSYNETLRDKEFMAMLVSCNYLTEMKVRGCKGLTSMAVVSMSKSCKRLQAVDIMHCCGVGAEAVELFVLNSPQLRRVEVDKNKLSDVARTWASYKFIEVVF